MTLNNVMTFFLPHKPGSRQGPFDDAFSDNDDPLAAERWKMS